MKQLIGSFEYMWQSMSYVTNPKGFSEPAAFSVIDLTLVQKGLDDQQAASCEK